MRLSWLLNLLLAAGLLITAFALVSIALAS
jgi:hypothetical protein